MISKQLPNTPQTNAQIGLEKNQTALSILSFLSSHLPLFEKEIKSLKIEQEDEISEQLNLFLQDRAKLEKYLLNFNAKKGVDFSINISPFTVGTPSIFVIEAKRLPPTNKKDYVRGNTGGIERFKREQTGYGAHLCVSAMLGYVQKFDKSHWHTTVNNWVGELITKETDIVWEESDKLMSQVPIADFISQHQRLTQCPITLYHFWLLVE